MIVDLGNERNTTAAVECAAFYIHPPFLFHLLLLLCYLLFLIFFPPCVCVSGYVTDVFVDVGFSEDVHVGNLLFFLDVSFCCSCMKDGGCSF